MTTRRTFTLLAGAATLARPALAQSLTKVSVGQVTTTTLSFAAVVLAQQAGIFREEGLDVEILEFRGSGVLLPQLTSRRVMVGYPNPDILIVSQQPGKSPLPLRFFYNATRVNAWEIAVLDKSPIKMIADLKGKKIGIGAATFGNVPITKAMFRDIGIEVGRDVELVPVGVGAAAFLALTSGQVDALNLFDAQHATLEVSGTAIRRLEMPPKIGGLMNNGFVTHNDTIRDQGDVLARFGRGVAKATIACQVNPEAAVKAFWKAYPNQKPSQGDEAKIMKDQIFILNSRLAKYLAFPPGQPKRFGENEPRVWRDFIQALHDGGEIADTKIDLDKLYTNQFVDGFNKFDVEAAVSFAKKLS